MLHDDYVMRMIRQLSAAILRIAGHRERGEYHASLDEAGRAWTDALGVPRELVDAMDGPSLAKLLGAPERRELAARLLREEALSHRATGNASYAEVLERRAQEIDAS